MLHQACYRLSRLYSITIGWYRQIAWGGGFESLFYYLHCPPLTLCCCIQVTIMFMDIVGECSSGNRSFCKFTCLVSFERHVVIRIRFTCQALPAWPMMSPRLKLWASWMSGYKGGLLTHTTATYFTFRLFWIDFLLTASICGLYFQALHHVW